MKARKRNVRRAWQDWELEALRRLYPDHPAAQLARALKRSERGIYAQANLMGLKKSAAFYESDRSGRIQRGKQDPRLQATQFQPGLTPWNKGHKGWKAGGRSAETRFKPGRPPWEASNYKPIGSLRMSKDGYLERKVTDDPSLYPVRRWVAVHRLVWQAAHGEIPAGHAVVFRRGQHTTIEGEVTADRLELVTRAELMRRNSLHTNYPREICQLIQLRGALNRQINNQSKQREEQDHRPA